MWNFYIYAHRESDTGKLFYIGKGTNRMGKPYYERAHSKYYRSDWWSRIVSKHGRTVEILCHCRDGDSAIELEQYFIKHFGKRSTGGMLINLTEGGDGAYGRICKESTRLLMSIQLRGKKRGHHSEAHKLKIGLALLGKPRQDFSLSRSGKYRVV